MCLTISLHITVENENISWKYIDLGGDLRALLWFFWTVIRDGYKTHIKEQRVRTKGALRKLQKE